MSTRCAISSSPSGSTLARFAPASTPAWMSASISARVIRTSDPSPMRVGMPSIAPSVVSRACRAAAGAWPRLARPPPATRGYRAAPPAVSGGYFGKVDGGAGQTVRRPRTRRRPRAERRHKGARPRGERGLVQGLWGKPSWGGLRLPAKGAIHSLPQRMLRRREAARTRAKRRLPGRYRAGADPGWGRIRALKMAEGRRAGPLWGRPPRRPSGRGSPGAGANQEDRRYQHLALAAGFSETGSVARRTLGATC